MNIYLISQEVNDNYDTYDAAVVAAENKEAASRTHPNRRRDWSDKHLAWVWPGDPDDTYDINDWTTPKHVTVKLLAENVPNLSAGVILASFNAG